MNWDGLNRRDEPSTVAQPQDIINLFMQRARADDIWRTEVVKKLDDQTREFNEFRDTYGPTLLDITQRAAYWSGIKDEALRKLITTGLIAAVIAIGIGAWTAFKGYLK